MWSIMSSMKLRRKTSKRGEGDINVNSEQKSPPQATAIISSKDRSANTETREPSKSNPSASSSSNSKVERKESTRIGSGATRFLRSLRTGHLGSSNKETHLESSGNIALVELKPKPECHAAPLLNDRVTHPPERSQSFQEKRLGVSILSSTGARLKALGQSSSSGTKNGSNGIYSTINPDPVKVKHSRTQSFICTTSQQNGGGTPVNALFKRDSSNYSVHHTNIVALNSTSNSISFCPDPQQQQQIRAGVAAENHYSSVAGIGNGRKNPYETIYENLEIIRQQQAKHHRSKVKSSSSSSLKTVGITVVDSSIKTSSSFSSTGNIMTIFEQEKERRLPSTRKLSKDTCYYEINYSDYMNIDTTKKNISDSNPVNPSLETLPKDKPNMMSNGIHHARNASTPCLSTGFSIGSEKSDGCESNGLDSQNRHYATPSPSCSSSSTLPCTTAAGAAKSSALLSKNGLSSTTVTENGIIMARKLRRSISEAQPGSTAESISLAKFQSKVLDTSKTIYSTVSNGLSIWSFQKSGKYISKNNSGSGKDSPYPIYSSSLSPVSPLHGKNGNAAPVEGVRAPQQQQPILSATLPRPSSNYHTSVKLSPSLRKEAELRPRAINNLNRTNSSVTLSKPFDLVNHSRSSSSNVSFSVTPSRSIPNLKDELKIYQQFTPNNLNNVSSHSQLVVQQHARSNSNCQPLSNPAAATRSASVKLYHSNVHHYHQLSRLNRNRIVSTPPVETNRKLVHFPNNVSPHPPPCVGIANEHVYENSSCSSNPSTRKNSSDSSASKEEQQELSSSLIKTMSNDSPPETTTGSPDRDPASLKQVKYGPGHEKYPSWPVSAASAGEIDPAGELSAKILPNGGSSRSKSWTEQTDYPKEKVQSYARPYMKRTSTHGSYTQQLKTVMEKSEATSLANNNASNTIGLPIVPPPKGYRDLYKVNSTAKSPNNKAMYLAKGEAGDKMEKEYNIPSPPERDSASKALTEEDLEIYAKKYEERMSQYVQSEGYHSYISSECSSYISSGTPFLDQLRRESESNEEFWCGDSCDPNDPLFGMSHLATSGRESVTTVVTNSSGSSGAETLKWQGSNGDLTSNSINNNTSSSSNSSSAGSVSAGSRGWEQNIARSAKISSPRKIHPDAVLVHNGIRHIKSKLEANSSPLRKHEQNLKKFPLSTYTRPTALSLSSEKNQQTPVATVANSVVPDMKKCNKVASPTSPSHKETKKISPIIDTSKPPSVAERILELEQQQHATHLPTASSKQNLLHHHTGGNNLTTSSSSAQTTMKDIPTAAVSNDNISSQPNVNNFTDKFVKSSSLANLRETGCKAQPQHPSSNISSHLSVKQDIDDSSASKASPSSLGYHNMWSPTSSSENNLLRSLDRQHHNSTSSNNSLSSTPVSYSYLDPEKKHKVADMTLKAIQKKALLAYYERHTAKSSLSSSPGTSDEASAKSFSPTNESPNKSFNGSTSSSEITELSHSASRSLSLPREVDKEQFNNASVAEELLASPNLNKETRSGDMFNTNRHNNSQSLSSQSAPSVGYNSSIHGQSTQDSSSISMTSSKGDFGRTSTSHPSGSHQVNSFTQMCEDANGESARMAYMSKYLPHLNRDRDPISVSMHQSNWNGLADNPSDGVVSLSHEPEVVPAPPERPPKKPHLRNISQQNNGDGSEPNKPPPPLPRAPIRHPAGNNIINTNGTPSGSPPPLPSKPQPQLSHPGLSMATTKTVTSLTAKRCSTPDLPLPPPPPPIGDDDQIVLNDDDPLPPPPAPNEVNSLHGSKLRHGASQSSSYLHKDSYLAQRKERSLGYEGRYRRTLSPSGLGSGGSTNSGDHASESSTASSTSSTEKMDSTLSPTAWERYHNIGAPSTTVVFSSQEISKCSQPVTMMSPTPQGSLFHRSASSESNLVNNKTGFSQPTVHPAAHMPPPPIAQVAPLRGIQPRLDTMDSYQYNSSYPAHNGHFNDSLKSYTLNSATQNSQQADSNGMPTHRSSSLNQGDHKFHHHRPSRHSAEESAARRGKSCNGITGAMHNGAVYKDLSAKKVTPATMTDAQCQITPNGLNDSPNSTPMMKSDQFQSVTVVVSPLRFESMRSKENKKCSPTAGAASANKENSRFVNGNDASCNKSEVSFRVNCTSDASSQTESGNEDDKDEGDSALPTEPNSLSLTLSSKSSSISSSCNDMTSSATAKGSNGSIGPSPASNAPSPTMSLSSYKGREKSQEEIDCEELSRDLVKQLPQGDRLQTLLVPLPQSKTSAHYMEGIFHIESRRPDQAENGRNSASPDHSPKSPDLQKIATSPASVPQRPQKQQQQQTTQSGDKPVERCNGGPLPADSPYFTTSECKAKFLTQYVKDIHKESINSRDNQQELIKQKEELVSRIGRKLEILRIEQSEIREEIQSNDQLGHIVIERVQQTAKRNEFDKFKLHVEEIEEITSLLLGLSGRLARAENALMQIENPNPQEKKILESKRDKLQEQLVEAKTLKENIDRRSAQVAGFLQKYLAEEEFADYQHFTKMKAKLIIDAREIDEKIKLGEEQMAALQETLSFTSSSASSSTSNTN